MKLEKITRDFIKTLTEPQKKRTAAYDSKGIVTRIEEGIAWVKLAGSKIETPLQMTIAAEPGDEVQARIGNGTGWLTGNGTAPPTDDTVANISYKKAKSADEKAVTAQNAAAEAYKSAEEAAAAADSARTSANSASEYASRALGNLATVQSVAETLAWITQHGTMTLTSDTEPVPSHIYFVQDANGDYTVNNVKYSIVAEPDPDSMSSYYELSIDESLNNYVGTHLALTGEGLWLLPATSGVPKVLIATGAGTTYTTAGTYIIDSSGGILASFRADGTTIGSILESYLTQDYHSIQMTDKNGNVYFHVSDLRNRQGVVQRTMTDKGDGSSTCFYLHPRAADTNYTVTVSDDSGGGISSKEKSRFYFNSAPTDGAVITVTYNSDTDDNKAYTLGVRKANSYLGAYSYAEGELIEASGYISHAEGSHTEASGYTSHAEGNYTEATGMYCHSEGGVTKATGMCDHAEGMGTVASGGASHAEGDDTEASGMSSHAEGNSTTASGEASHAEGEYSEASGQFSHAEGRSTKATEWCAHAEGRSTTASGGPSHAEGEYCVASGDDAHAEGSYSEATEWCAHAEGYYCEASAEKAHAEGDHSVASGYASHAHGINAVAQGYAQTVIGKWNNPAGHASYYEVEDTDPLFIIGNGDSQYSKSDAMKVDWKGNTWIAGSLTQNSDKRLKDHMGYLSEDAAEFIRKLKPARFIKDNRDHVGFYAQDVAMVDPWKCLTGKTNGYMTLNYIELIAPLVAYCQSLEERIERLEKGE